MTLWITRFSQRKRPKLVPTVPTITVGKFKGRPVNDLSDDELEAFLKADARRQPRRHFGSFDARHYWYAKYEFERRKSSPAPRVPLEIADSDTAADIALKLVRLGFRGASMKHHPDHDGGDNSTMRRLIAAREFAVKRIMA